MTKVKRRNLRANAAFPRPLPMRRLSTDTPSSADRGNQHAAAATNMDGVDPNPDQIDLKGFIDMTCHSSDFLPRASSCCSSHNDSDDAMAHWLSQEQQSSAPLPARNVVNFLRNKSGIKLRVGALNGKRVDYFKGSAAVKALLSPAYAKLKDVPKVTTKQEAEQCLHNIIPFAFFLRVDRGASTGGKDSPKVVEINQQQLFNSDLYYVWLYEGSQLALKLAGLGMVALMLAGVMFPLWPPTMRLGVWYLSVAALGLIGLFFAIAIVRLIFWCITIVVAKPGIWIFPNLFEDVGFVDSFIPLWAWDVPPEPKKKKAATSAAAGGKKKISGANGASASGAAARQAALSNLGGQAPTAQPQVQVKPQQAAAHSQPAAEHGAAQTQSNASAGPGAKGDSLEDIN